MQIYVRNFLFLVLNINYIYNSFKIDFLFLPQEPEPSEENNKIEEFYNQSFSKNLSYYFNIKPMIKICFTEHNHCFYIEAFFQTIETILNLNLLKLNLPNFKSFKPLENVSDIFAATDAIRFGEDNQNLINDYYFIAINDTFNKETNKIGLGKMSLYNWVDGKNFSLLNQLNTKNMIESQEITIKYFDNFAGEIIFGTNYTGRKFEESLYIEFYNKGNDIRGYLQSIYIEDSTITTNKRQQKDLLAHEKRKIITIEPNSTFITLNEEIFGQITTISFISFINAEICQIKKNEIYDIQYLVCNDDILNSNLDTLIIVFNWKKNIRVSLNELFLPYESDDDKKNLFGIISTKNNESISIGTVLLKKYLVCLNNEKGTIRLFSKNIQIDVVPTDIFGIVGIITLTIIICILMIYMVSTICGKDKYEPNYAPRVQKFLLKKTFDSSSMMSNESSFE